MLLGAFVLFFRLGTSSWNFDEYYYGLVGQQFLEGNFAPRPGLHPYLGVYLLGVFPRLTGEDSATAIRVLPALAGLGTGWVLFLFARGVADLWAGAAAFALWCLLPHASEMAGAPLADIKIERFGLLDSFMALFMASALYSGWRWATTRSWGWAIATGVFAGLAMSSKLAGGLVLIPIALLALCSVRDRSHALQLLCLVTLPFLVLWLSFTPVLSEAFDRLEAIRTLARQEQVTGHATVVAGHLYPRDPPWWSNGWFMWKGVGPVGTVGLVAGAVLGLFSLQRRLTLYLGAAALIPAIALPVLYSVALPHYYFVWMAPLTLLAALGIHRFALHPGWKRKVAGALCIALALVAAKTVVEVATLNQGDYRSAASILRDAGLERGPVAVLGYAPVLCGYLPAGATVSKQPDSSTNAIVIDPVQARRGDPTGIQGMVTLDPHAYEFHRADRLSVYLRRKPVPTPTSEPRPDAPGLGCYAG
jgi:4-amino-4-deoxy-L-arabinose transferase-like glycosyltransferase